jgi:head-tail adaptor
MSLKLFERDLTRCGQTIVVQKRNLGKSDFESSQPVKEFLDIDKPEAIVKTISSVRGGNKLFAGVQIVDDATHIFCTLYSVEIRSIEQSNYFILFKARRFRILAVTNIDEQDKILVIQATERGSCNIEATKA